ncbi:biotin--[acetyl-CoA-carboxylase] ligase [bacterium]|nr:biotin--[acetyl-CoA-carboxylase] ligase [bacterium]
MPEDFTSCGAELIGRSIRVLPVIDSTNDLLKAEAEDSISDEGDIIIAEHQTAGRGRLDRQWESPPGKSLLLSILLKPEILSEKLQLAGLMISLGILDGLNGYLESESIRLKWPNDLIVGGRKLCGILSDAGVDKTGRNFVVAGIGININQTPTDFAEPLRDTATSLYIMTGSQHSRSAVLKQVIARVDEHYRRLKTEGGYWIAPAWLERAGISGREIEVKENKSTIRGVCKGLNEDGALLLELPEGAIREIYSGDVN